MNNNLKYDATRQERIEDLFNNLVNRIELSPAEITTYTTELCDIYSDPSFRHAYSLLSLALESYCPDERDSLAEKIKTLEFHAKTYVDVNYKDNEQKESILSKIGKLSDHVDLETLRLARIDQVEFIGKTAEKDLNAADGKLNETSEKAKELSNQISKFQEQSITILGIFSALVISFATITQFTSAGLQNLADIPAFKIAFFVCLSFFFLFNIIFLLMYCVSKIAKSSVATNCQNRSCQNCVNCSNIIKKLVTKYPYVFYFEVVSIALCIILCLIASQTSINITITVPK